MVDKCQQICKEYGIDDFDEEEKDKQDGGKLEDAEANPEGDAEISAPEPAPAIDIVMTDTSGNFVADTQSTPDSAEL